MIDPETKKYVDDILALQNLKVSSVISTMFEILEKKNLCGEDEWEKALEKAHALANLAVTYGVQFFTDEMIRRAHENEELR